MCESMRLYTEKILNEGEKRGEKKGLVKTLMIMLKHKLGKISPEVEIKIRESSEQQLELLTIKIFDVENEEDILDVLK